ncbi:hypothetical protein SeLEV6574_g07587 [Synchytrium endobioticum]|uniref:PH domain-containing protein n=2 Tax=Synchytrium endobioticum TaxID=286115 RepID=A0A507CCQ3_9FUNG|nr:hypothetical protein SeLEV6574_g07587 [Synchytrium endobioticum]
METRVSPIEPPKRRSTLKSPATDYGENKEYIAYPFSDTDDSGDEFGNKTPDGRTNDAGDFQTSSPTLSESNLYDGAESDGDEAEYQGPGLDALVLETTLKNGYLKKKGEKRKRWKKRWFVLRGNKLAYYKNDKEYVLLSIIDLADVHAIAEVTLKKRSNVFGLVTRQRSYFMQAPSKEACQEWLTVLRNRHAKIQHSPVTIQVLNTPTSRPRQLQQSSPSSNELLLYGLSTSGNEFSLPPIMTADSLPLMAMSVTSATHDSYGENDPRIHSSTTQSSQIPFQSQQSAQYLGVPADGDTMSLPDSTVTSESQLTIISTPSIALVQSTSAISPQQIMHSQTASPTPSSHSNNPVPIHSLLSTGATSQPIKSILIRPPVLPRVIDSTVSGTSLASDVFESNIAIMNTQYANSPTQPSPAITATSVSATSLPPYNSSSNSPSSTPSGEASPTSASASPRLSRRGTGNYSSHGMSSSDEEDYMDDGTTGAGGKKAEEVFSDSALYSGYLYKLSGRARKIWKKRWFVLRHGKIAVYKDDKEYVPTKLIPLSKVLDVLEIDAQSKHHRHCFKIVLPKRTMVVCATSKEAVDGWVEALNDAHRKVLTAETAESER